MKKIVAGLALLLLAASVACAQAACPNQAASITIPLSGSTAQSVCDQNGNVLAGPFTVAISGGSGFLSGTTAPSVMTVGSGSSTQLQYAANGAAAGSSGTLNICFTLPNPAVCGNVPFSVGAKVSSLTFGTTTP